MISVVASFAAAQTGGSIDWGSCPSVSHPELGAECASATLPLYHVLTGTATIDVALMRIPAPEERRRQLWFLDGGPGDPATASVERLAHLIADPELEILTFDHRGTGRTALLECPAQEATDSPEGAEIARDEWLACIEYITANRTDLDGLSTTEVSHDLHELVRRFREDNVPVFVLGISYGSYLVQRYLRLYPEQPNAVILDGVVPPDWGFDEFDAGLDRIGRQVLDRCADDSSCGEHLGSDPVGRAERLLARQREGHCYPLTLQPSVTRLVLGVSLMVDEVPPGLLAAFIHRMDRCDWHDQMAVLHLFRNVFDSIEEAPSHSPVLQRHVAMSELWSSDAPTTEELGTALDDYVMSTEVSASFAVTAESWPVYPRPDDSRRFSTYQGPMLMMHGSLDPTMPVERLDPLRDWYSAPEQYFIVMPDLGHVVLNEGDCARDIYLQFLQDPVALPDTSCVSDIAPLDFGVSPDAARRLVGTTDLWGDRPSVLRSVVFLGLYRWGAVTLGALGLLVCVAVRRHASVSHPSRLRVVLSLLGWLVVVVVLWQGLFLLPYLLPYLAAGTVAIAGAGLAIQGMLGWWLIRGLYRW